MLKGKELENIFFKIGQPNTGKSYFFEKQNLESYLGPLNTTDKNLPVQYIKIPVSGGVGNEFKGLQNTDLAISFDPVNKSIKFGDFLKVLMQAIITPDKNFVVFLDDFHNQNISSLLSEYTPLFKKQQKINLLDIINNFDNSQKQFIDDLKDNQNEIFSEEMLIKKWNSFIDMLSDTAKEMKKHLFTVSLTNRISGDDLKLIYPTNFYLFGAANYNEHTYNIFADWQDRAFIKEIDPFDNERTLLDFKTSLSEIEDKEFIDFVIQINKSLRKVLEQKQIYSYQKYCFGFFKIFDNPNSLVKSEDRAKTIKFIFSMIKNSLIQNGKASEINEISFDLLNDIEKHKDNKFESSFKNYICDKEIKDNDFKLLHQLGLYEE